MKKSEILIGSTYCNGKGRTRKVVEFGKFLLYPGQMDFDCVRYEIVSDGTKKNKAKGNKSEMTRTDFASWAKEKLDGKEANY